MEQESKWYRITYDKKVRENKMTHEKIREKNAPIIISPKNIPHLCHN